VKKSGSGKWPIRLQLVLLYHVHLRHCTQGRAKCGHSKQVAKNEKERATTYPCIAEDEYFKNNLKEMNYRNMLVLLVQGFFSHSYLLSKKFQRFLLNITAPKASSKRVGFKTILAKVC
jgi:hypothetical protein